MMMRKLLVLSFSMLFFASSIIFAQGSTATTTPASKFLLKGYGVTTFEKEEDEPSNFETSFNPIFLWKQGDKFFFESEVEFEVEEEGLDIGLEYAQAFYILNDYVTLGFGKFLNPVNYFMERLHPAWINKLPDMPLGLTEHTGFPLLPGSQMGFQLRGGFPVGNSKVTYAVFLSNGPTIVTETTPQGGDVATDVGQNNSLFSPQSEGEEGPGVGLLNYDNFHDNNDNKAVGGRIGIYLFPQLEIGYGFQTAKLGDKGSEFENVKAINHAVDLNYVNDIPGLKGKLDIRAQWVWLNVDNPGIPPLDFQNKSNAGYAQIAFQPNGVENDFFRNVEFVFRADRVDMPNDAEAPINTDTDRLSFGVDYWLSPSSVFKLAFESVKNKFIDGNSKTETKFIAQFSFGF